MELLPHLHTPTSPQCHPTANPNPGALSRMQAATFKAIEADFLLANNETLEKIATKMVRAPQGGVKTAPFLSLFLLARCRIKPKQPRRSSAQNWPSPRPKPSIGGPNTTEPRPKDCWQRPNSRQTILLCSGCAFFHNATGVIQTPRSLSLSCAEISFEASATDRD